MSQLNARFYFISFTKGGFRLYPGISDLYSAEKAESEPGRGNPDIDCSTMLYVGEKLSVRLYSCTQYSCREYVGPRTSLFSQVVDK